MKYKFLFVFTMLLAGLLSACSGSGGGVATQPAGEDPVARPTLPPEYAGKTNSIANDANAAEAGKQLFETNCASCHGTLAKGDGPAAQSLNPHPKDLSAEMGDVQDDYLFWRISEGGMMAPFHSAMPAWKSILTQEQRWQMIVYLRTLQP